MKRRYYPLMVLTGLFTGCAMAEKEAQPEAEEAAEIPSLIYLQYLNQQAPDLLCEQDPKIACLQMPGELCKLSVRASAERCGPKLLTQWPASFQESESNATGYAREYRLCVLQDWVDEYGLQPERLAACGIDVAPQE